MISIIVASDPNGVIGKGNAIPWHIPEDLKLFKQRTMGSSIIMGRLTWDSLPRKPLLGRVNYIVSRGEARPCPHTCLEESLAGPIWCKSLPEAIKDAELMKDDHGITRPIYIIGGEQIYQMALELDCVDRIILSRLKKEHEGDRYFKIPSNWMELDVECHSEFDVVWLGKIGVWSD